MVTDTANNKTTKRRRAMKHLLKCSLAIIIYAVLIVILDAEMGIGIKDKWDKLMKWSRQ
jgi:hypothetical protein